MYNINIMFIGHTVYKNRETNSNPESCENKSSKICEINRIQLKVFASCVCVQVTSYKIRKVLVLKQNEKCSLKRKRKTIAQIKSK